MDLYETFLVKLRVKRLKNKYWFTIGVSWSQIEDVTGVTSLLLHFLVITYSHPIRVLFFQAYQSYNFTCPFPNYPSIIENSMDFAENVKLMSGVKVLHISYFEAKEMIEERKPWVDPKEVPRMYNIW